MILPIVAYGDPILRKVAQEITSDYPKLQELIANMWETMHNADGLGLAAPQIGLSLQLFMVDLTSYSESEELSAGEQDKLKHSKKVFINAKIQEEKGEAWDFNEGCLSIPNISEDVKRKAEIKIQYLDETFTPHTEVYDGLLARVIQHEYDHIQGILFTDKLSSLKKRLLKSKLEKIARGKIKVAYTMRFPKSKKRR